MSAVTFTPRPNAEATEPAEARGLPRDGVRLLIATPDKLQDSTFHDLTDHLRPGDLLVVNTSATRAGAVDGEHSRFGPVVVHLATELADGAWVVEIRSAPGAADQVRTCEPGDEVRLDGGPVIRLEGPHGPATPEGWVRLWRTQPVRLVLNSLPARPIRYGYLDRPWPLENYQTVFADPGDLGASAEMPSAGRPFTPDLVTRLVSRGVRFAPITLHAGVSSLESGESPPAEPYRVPDSTAELVNWTRRTGGRVVAVGTTVTRALESATGPDGRVRKAQGWTDLVITPDRGVRAVQGLVTGWHDPEASHLLMLEAVAGAGLVQRAYRHAVDAGYLWHEFGDSCLLLP
ncbi:S-adenosylmethionine:tRNA ribosyltransferase-isomerase [Kineosporia succinea]|uniref:S-adenosylmethionine:tRNA ribosyltransferase-isomerase n=1 Tax=Kineosporia succinea TaxID=84632 RepID=A0ABT9P379_9ACTN|nr:S-adenosylmethionine:tRNA ribosyltransferase-isomerase [Kineosporia succinea]MDP9826859.1 S-adenosylmethionine:tRNA ribosyltransferase-isomerase [Kineosporia succinea]